MRTLILAPLAALSMLAGCSSTDLAMFNVAMEEANGTYWPDQSESQRYLVDPAEILRMNRDEALLFFNAPVTLRAPLKVYKVKYFRERCWRGQYDSWKKPSARAPRKSPIGGPATT